jgi:phosphopantetheine adenylyltransferase
MDSKVYKFIDALHASRYRCALVVAGAGSKALSWLLEISGSSRTLIEATIPYSKESLAAFLGKYPDSAVSMKTAQYMAQKAFCKAKVFEEDQRSIIGLGCTATIVTDREKQGAHRGYISTMSNKGLKNWKLELQKGLLTRSEEEESISLAIINAISNTINIQPKLNIDFGKDSKLEELELDYGVSRVVEKCDYIYVDVELPMEIENKVNAKAILSGSFDPLHSGHISLLEASKSYLDMEVIFELSMSNVDKADLTIEKTNIRINQAFGKWPIIVTRSDTFIKKAKLFPGCVFVVGFDTALRVIDFQYYENNIDNMINQLEEIKELGCRFLVASRCINGILLTEKDLEVPEAFKEMFFELPVDLFREDISSTGIRTNSLGKEL